MGGWGCLGVFSRQFLNMDGNLVLVSKGSTQSENLLFPEKKRQKKTHIVFCRGMTCFEVLGSPGRGWDTPNRRVFAGVVEAARFGTRRGSFRRSCWP